MPKEYFLTCHLLALSHKTSLLRVLSKQIIDGSDLVVERLLLIRPVSVKLDSSFVSLARHAPTANQP